MARKFKDLRARMPAEAQARASAMATDMLAEMALQDLRKSRKITQKDMAEVLAIRQASISELEGRDDALLSTVRRYIEAIGGELDVIARFPDFSIRLNQFDGTKAGTPDGSRHLADSGS